MPTRLGSFFSRRRATASRPNPPPLPNRVNVLTSRQAASLLRARISAAEAAAVKEMEKASSAEQQKQQSRADPGPLGGRYGRASGEDELVFVKEMNVSVGNTIGRGSFADVKAAYCHDSDRLMALKVVNKRLAPPPYLTMQLPREIDLLRSLSHPRVVSAHQVLTTRDQVLILMDLAANGDLLAYLRSRRRLPEEEARYMFLQVAEAMVYLHSNSIAHRDLKPENILLDHDMCIKVADFGFAIDVSRSTAISACGSQAYAAPEVFNRARGTEYNALQADVWSLGILLYVLLTGRSLFSRDNTQRTPVVFPRDVTLSFSLQDLICNMLRRDPTYRITCQDIASHYWMTEGEASRPIAVQSPKTKANLGFQFSHHVVMISSSNNPSTMELLAIPSTVDVGTVPFPPPRRRRSVCFLCSIFSKIASAFRRRRGNRDS